MVLKRFPYLRVSGAVVEKKKNKRVKTFVFRILKIKK